MMIECEPVASLAAHACQRLAGLRRDAREGGEGSSQSPHQTHPKTNTDPHSQIPI